MFQIRIHGRGGQGVVTAAKLLSVAAFEEGSFAQAFPTFGSERTGAPVVSYCRIDDREIRVREPIVEPNALIVQDPTLLHQVDVFSGVASSAYVLINTTGTVTTLGIDEYARRFSVGRILTTALIISLVCTLATLFALGVAKGKIARMSIWRSGLQVAIIRSASAGIGFAIGHLVSSIAGSPALPTLFFAGPLPGPVQEGLQNRPWTTRWAISATPTGQQTRSSPRRDR